MCAWVDGGYMGKWMRGATYLAVQSQYTISLLQSIIEKIDGVFSGYIVNWDRFACLVEWDGWWSGASVRDRCVSAMLAEWRASLGLKGGT